MEKWTMPDWMEKYVGTIIYEKAECERLMNAKTNVVVNAPLSLEVCIVQGQIQALTRLHKAGLLAD